jgi:alpha-L-arabinofuranosidase
MIRGRIAVDRDFAVSDIDRRIFGAFVEHMGRCVYGGIFEPGHATATEQGFRGDVLELTRELGPTIIRYPGGNFLSGYNWEDGVGPVEERPRRLDLAWYSTETNQFGTNEFIDWCRQADIEPMFGVNLGTRGPDEARRFLEYCNHPGGTELSDLRRKHGYEKPHDIKFWCLGNEMDGPWQICQKTAEEYGRVAQETAKVMRWVDPTVTLTACGSSHREMSTYADWEYKVLDLCFEKVDFISLHTYFTNPYNDTAEYFSNIEKMDAFIKEVVAICDAVAAKRRSFKRVMLCFDEWNVWYKARSEYDRHKPGWPEAPHLIEEVYNFEDAMVVGGALITLLNNADRVKAACLAQLVNVIGPIMTETGGPAWRQTIFYPFSHAARLGRGRVLRTSTESPVYDTHDFPDMPYLLSSVVDDEENGRVTVFALNRHLSESMDFTLDLRGFDGDWTVAEAIELTHFDMKAVNTKDRQDTVKPQTNRAVAVDGTSVRAELKPASWNVISVQRR